MVAQKFRDIWVIVDYGVCTIPCQETSFGYNNDDDYENSDHNNHSNNNNE